jgi:hypothetical protein
VEVHESATPAARPASIRKCGDAIQRDFQFVDKALGDLVAKLDTSTTLMLVSDHGFGPFHKLVHVNNWLRQQRWLKIKPTPKAQLKAALFRMGLSPMTVYDLLMLFGQCKMKRSRARQRSGLAQDTVPLFHRCGLVQHGRLSLGNRRPDSPQRQGTRSAGQRETRGLFASSRANHCSDLWDGDPETGETVVQDIYCRKGIYSGAHLRQASEIVFVPYRKECFGFDEYEFGSHLEANIERLLELLAEYHVEATFSC